MMTFILAAMVTQAAATSMQPATRPSESLARLTIIRPKDGMTREFEEGYKRHLDWHRRNDDPWTWHGWTIATGDRFGTFVDASFGHDAEALASPVRPADDAADNRLNTLPYVETLEAYILQHRTDFKGGAIDFNQSPFVQTFEYQLEPAFYDDWSQVLRTVHVEDRSFAWFEFVNGGEHPRFLLLLPARSIAEINLGPIDVLPSVLRDLLSPDEIDILRRAARSVRSELLRYRPELTYAPRGSE